MKKLRDLSISILWPYLPKSFKKEIIILIFLTIISTLGEAFSIGALVPFLSSLFSDDLLDKNIFIKTIIDAFNVTSKGSLVLYLGSLFTLLIIISSLFKIYVLNKGFYLSSKIGHFFSLKVFDSLLIQKFSVYLNSNKSKSIASVTSYISGLIYCIDSLNRLISGMFLNVLIIVMLLIINFSITFNVIFSLVVAYIIIGFLTKKTLKVNSNLITTMQENEIKLMNETLGAYRNVLLEKKQEHFSLIFKNFDYLYKMKMAQNKFISAFPRYFLEVLSIFVIIFSIYQSQINSNEQFLVDILPTLAAIIFGAQKVLPALQQSYYGWVGLISAESPVIKTISLLNLEKDKSYSYNKKTSIIKFKFNDHIEFKNVFFSYINNKNIEILKNLNFKINKGEKIGIIGTTGSGKSTLLDLIMCLLEPSKGRILIDKTDIFHSNLVNEWRSKIGHVPQNIYLTDLTFYENIAFGLKKDEISKSKVIQAAKNANIHDFIDNLPKKYETYVGEGGIKLSGGQRQRIALARALYEKKEVLIFDEATSSLDTKTEKDVINTINNISSDITTISIAHRYTALRYCDRIFEIKNGELNRIISYKEIKNFDSI